MSVLATAFYETSWFKAVAYVVAAIVVARIVDWILARRDRTMAKLLGRTPDDAERTRYVMIRRLTVASILFVGVAVALLQFAFVGDLAKAMLASAAIIAGVIGIAARAPIANLVSGIMIAFSQPVRLNDYISVDDVYGTVEQVSLTYTYVRTDDGRRVVIPNEAFASTAVHNYSMGTAGSMVTVDLALPRGADIDRTMTVMREIGEELAPAPDSRRITVEVADIADGGACLRLYAFSPNPSRRREIASNLRAAILRRLASDNRASGATIGSGD